MAKGYQSLDVSNVPELLRFARPGQASNEPRILRRADEAIALIVPAKKVRAKRAPRGGVLTREDALFALIGIGQSKIQGGISGKKHDYVLQAFHQTHQ